MFLLEKFFFELYDSLENGNDYELHELIPSIFQHHFSEIFTREEIDLFQNVIYSWFSTDEEYQSQEIDLMKKYFIPKLLTEKTECEKRQNVVRIICIFASSMLAVWLI